MKRLISILFASAAIGLIVAPAHAILIDRGADSLGKHLIYDPDFNITWYDYTKSSDTWQNQVNWANALSVNFGGNTYNGWRLPTALDQNGNGTYNNIGSEMGHLYYTELGNGAGKLLTYTGPFANLLPNDYWSGTQAITIYSIFSTYAWEFNFYGGSQSYVPSNYTLFALAVRPGDVGAAAPVPEPSTLLLLGSGLSGVVLMRRMRKK